MWPGAAGIRAHCALSPSDVHQSPDPGKSTGVGAGVGEEAGVLEPLEARCVSVCGHRGEELSLERKLLSAPGRITQRLLLFLISERLRSG